MRASPVRLMLPIPPRRAESDTPPHIRQQKPRRGAGYGCVMRRCRRQTLRDALDGLTLSAQSLEDLSARAAAAAAGARALVARFGAG